MNGFAAGAVAGVGVGVFYDWVFENRPPEVAGLSSTF